MKFIHGLILGAVALALTACGGGGGTSSSGGGIGFGGSVFMTDSLDNHDHVWVTVKKVVMTSAAGNSTIFDDSAGKSIDLKRLRDASGERYAFISSAPTGSFTGVQITLDKTATLYPSGSSTGVTRVFTGNDGTNVVLNLTFASTRNFSGSGRLAIDFDLSNWNDDGSNLSATAFLREGNGDGLDDLNRHENEDYHGTVASLNGAAPTQTFTLTQANRTFRVTTDANTAIFRSNGQPSAILANGQRVEVRGSFSTTQNTLLATQIKIEDGNGQNGEIEVHGNAANLDAVAGTFTVDVVQSEGFQPTNLTVNVVTNSSTTFRGDHGVTLTQAEFFTTLATSSFVEVEGSYDAGTNTFTATKAKLEDDHGHHNGGGGEGEHHEAEATGPASAINSGAFTFDITANEWEGINIGPNTVIHVTTTSGTEFKGAHGSNLNQTQFFAALSSDTPVEVRGSFDPSTMILTAERVHIED